MPSELSYPSQFVVNHVDLNQVPHYAASDLGLLLFQIGKVRLIKVNVVLYEPRHEKTGFLHMRKQRRRSALR